MKFETHTLRNGMRILLAPNKGASSVTVMAMTGTGSRYESEKENGIAHFLEHMVFKGTKKRPNAKVIAEELDGVGGIFNAFTSKDHTAYYAKVDKRHFKTAFNVVTDIFLNPTFPSVEVKREKGTIIEEINMYQDMPMRNVLDEADLTMFGTDTPLGRTILGPKKNILAFTRHDFVEYFKRNYIAENSALCITGAFSKTEALKLVHSTLARMRTGVVPVANEYVHVQKTPHVNLIYKNTDQTHIVIAVPSVPLNDTQEATAEVLAAILGGGMSSRLFTQVRERRGLAYYVRAEHDGYGDVGSLYIRAGVSNSTAVEAVRVIMKELRTITKKEVSVKELLKAKEYIKGTTALSFDTTDAQAAYIGYTTLVRKRVISTQAFNKAIDSVTAGAVNTLAKKLLTTNMLNFTCVGPHKNKKTFLKELHV